MFAVALILSMAVLCFFLNRLVFWHDSVTAGREYRGPLRAGLIVLALIALVSGCRWCAFLALAFVARYRQRQRQLPPDSQCPFVSIFVPCFNEGETIEAAINSLLELDYPSYEVILVNDGSTDDTLVRAKRFEGRHGPCTVRVHHKSNGGKWSAHNLAFQRSTGELILCIDADSRVHPLALRKLVARMADPGIAAIAGQMRVRNRKSLITRLQGLEYLMANGAVRMGQGLFGTVLIVPGPIGMFRRSVLEEVWLKYTVGRENGHSGSVDGPFEGDTFAEDFDLSLAILCLGGRIVYEPEAVSYTKAPETQFALLNQRYRWIRGAMQVLRKFHRRAQSNPEVLSSRLLWWIASTCVLDLAVMPFLYLLGLALLLLLTVGGGNVPLLAGSFATFLLVQLSAGAFFVSIHGDNLRLLKVLPLYGLYNGFLLNSAWAISLLDEGRGKPMRW
ncbi:MAG: glycosyltransferase [Planctomycetota bacterium]